MDRAEAEARRLKRRYAACYDRGVHGMSCRAAGAGSGGCVWLRRIANAEEQADRLDAVVEKYQRLWGRWKVYARALERKGERRIGGLEEWRRREGRGGEREEYDRLRGFYRRLSREDSRVEEVDVRRRAEEELGRLRRREWEREREGERERYRSVDDRKAGYRGRNYDHEVSGDNRHEARGYRRRPNVRRWEAP